MEKININDLSFEELESFIEELEKKLSELQKANTKQNADKSENKKSDAELFADVVKSFITICDLRPRALAIQLIPTAAPKQSSPGHRPLTVPDPLKPGQNHLQNFPVSFPAHPCRHCGQSGCLSRR